MNIFTFKLQDLEKIIKNPRDLEKERHFLEGKFSEWDILPPYVVQFERSILEKIIIGIEAGDIKENQENAFLLVKWASILGGIFKSTGLSSSQIRNLFCEVRQIQQVGFEKSLSLRRFILLQPKIEYAAKRADKFGMSGLKSVLISAIELVDSKERFDHFVEFFEAILAYHKSYGGN